MAMMVMAMAVCLAFRTGGGTFDRSIQETCNRLLHSSGGTCCCFDAKLVEELDGPAPHTTTEHDIRIMLIDESRYLAGLVSCIIRIINDPD